VKFENLTQQIKAAWENGIRSQEVGIQQVGKYIVCSLKPSGFAKTID
jgi:hypothetical protein